MHNLSIFGTTSDSGKSTLTFVLAKLLQEQGYSCAPFKAQNYSNNSYVCEDGSEIGVAQYFQAKVLNCPTSWHLNPVLLKSGMGNKTTVIVEGQHREVTNIRAYYKQIDSLKHSVSKAFNYLDKNFDIVVAEGAGSPVELNLLHKDLSNTFTASEFNTKIVLVADIERGGIFASVYGTYMLLEESLRKNVVGVIINKFRGDLSLFDEGKSIIEERFGLKVLGVLPYTPFNFGFEDSLSLLNYKQNKQATLNVAVIAYPYMSNYNDFEPLIEDTQLQLHFIKNYQALNVYDMVILPGSKLTFADLAWLKEQGLDKALQEYKGKIFGICAGYQMLCQNLEDVLGIEAKESCSIKGLGLIDDDIIFQKQKILTQGKFEVFNMELEGFEIHHGNTKSKKLFFESERIYASFLHSIFDNDKLRYKLFSDLDANYKGYNFQEHKQTQIAAFINKAKEHLDINTLVQALHE